MALLEACEKGDFETARQVIPHVCDPNSVKDGNGWTPLHWACWHGDLDFARTLVEGHSCDPECRTTTTVKRSDNDVVPGTTPLHLASRCGHKSIVMFLITDMKCNPECIDNSGACPLHYACGQGHKSILEYLITGAKCNPECTDKSGARPLHYACKIPDSSISDVITFLLREMHCNPNCTTDDGDTPLSLTTDPVIIRELLMCGADPKNDYAKYSRYLPSSYPKEVPEPVVKVFVVGDRGTGKSTLTEAIKIHSKSTGLSRIAARITKVTQFDPNTGGVVPHEVESSKHFGHITLYDFAGHKEFYSGHESFVRKSIIGSCTTMFLLLTDLRKTDKDFKESIMYWLNFIDKRCSSLDKKPHVIIIGSHADEVKSKEEKSRKSSIISTLQNAAIFSSLCFDGYVALNCCYAKSPAMSELHRSLANSCNVLRNKVVGTFRSHCFLVYLLDKFHDSPAVVLNTVFHKIGEQSDVQLSDFLPQTIADLCSCCEVLNERGNIVFLKNSDNIEKSWIILDKMAILFRVTGTVFAPDGLLQYPSLATSTGVVPSSRIRSVFPDDPDMITQFLCYLEFCQEVTDPDVLQVLQKSQSALPTLRANSSDPVERFYFFSALVCIEPPGPVWQPDSQLFEYHSGWFLNCSKYGQFLTPRFLQVLLRRLAFTFAMIPYAHESPEHPAIQRRCMFWKNGIYWANRSGIETLVVVENLKIVTVLLRCLHGQEIDCIQFRSAIIRKVINAKEEFCPEVPTTEYFVHPEDATRYPLRPQSELSLVSCTEIAIAVATGEPATLDTNGTMTLIETFLYYESYAHLGKGILQQLFHESSPVYTQDIPDAFLIQIAAAAHANELTEYLMQMLNPHSPSCSKTFNEMVQALQSWRSQNHGTYKDLRMELDKFSVFAGRNPLEMASKHLQPPGLEPYQGLSQNECGSAQSVPGDEQSIPPSVELSSSQLHHEMDIRILGEAMKYGYVTGRHIVTLVMGAKGSGKTHVKDLICNQPCTQIQQSSPSMEIVISQAMVEGNSARIVHPGEVVEMVSDALEKKLVTGHSQFESMPMASLHELVRLVNMSPDFTEVFKADWLYLVTVGGYPTLADILPAFTQTISSAIIVSRLDQELLEIPCDQSRSKPQGQLCSLPLSSNEVILKHCFRAVQSRVSSTGKIMNPKIFIMGTRRDLEHTCQETRQEKNAKLLRTFRRAFAKNLDFYRLGIPEELMYPVNALSPNDEDLEVANKLRNAILQSHDEPIRTPLRWFLFVHILKKHAAERDVRVISIDECRNIAQEVHIQSEDSFQAALNHYVRLNVILYYPDILPSVVFCTPRVVLDKINELIKDSYLLRASGVEGRSGDWLQFRDGGVLTINHLQKFPMHYVSGVFSPDDLLKILTKFQIAFQLNEHHYFMPSLLPELTVPAHICGLATSSPAPLLIHCPKHWVPSEVFPSLIAFLLSNPQWHLCEHGGKPSCFYRNRVRFSLPQGQPGSVMLTDAFAYIEVRVNKTTPGPALDVCRLIRTLLFEGLSKAGDVLGRENIMPEIAFYCEAMGSECDTTPHLATISVSSHICYWTCSINTQIGGQLTAAQEVWLDSSSMHTHSATAPSTTTPSHGHLQGFDEKTFQITDHSENFEWNNHGFKLYIPGNALPSGIQECQVDVKTGLTGDFRLPENTKLVSGMYGVECPHRLTKDATIDIEHCANITDTSQVSSLHFVTAALSEEKLPYKLKLTEGEFALHCPFGSIQFRESFIFGVVALLSVSNRYMAQVFYEKKDTPNTWMAHFVIVKDLQICRNAVTQSLTAKEAKPGPLFDIEFELDEIELEIPFDPEGITLDNGWNITPLSYPMITKDQVEEFTPGRRIPSCQLQIKWDGSGDISELTYRVNICGAVPPSDAFSLHLWDVKPPPPPRVYSPPPPPHKRSSRLPPSKARILHMDPPSSRWSAPMSISLPSQYMSGNHLPPPHGSSRSSTSLTHHKRKNHLLSRRASSFDSHLSPSGSSLKTSKPTRSSSMKTSEPLQWSSLSETHAFRSPEEPARQHSPNYPTSMYGTLPRYKRVVESPPSPRRYSAHDTTSMACGPSKPVALEDESVAAAIDSEFDAILEDLDSAMKDIAVFEEVVSNRSLVQESIIAMEARNQVPKPSKPMGSDLDALMQSQGVPITVFNTDYTSKTVFVEEGMTCRMVCQVLAVKNKVDESPNLVLVERLEDIFLERELEDHELVADVYNTWLQEHNHNVFLFRSNDKKYDHFEKPMEYFSSTNQVPELEGWLYFKDGYEAEWVKVYCTLRDSGLYYSKLKSAKHRVLLGQFEDYQIYNGINFEENLSAPTEFCFALRPEPSQLTQVPGPEDIKVLCADSEETALSWTAGIRLAKYGVQLQRHFVEAMGSFVPERARSVSRSSDEYPDDYSVLRPESPPSRPPTPNIIITDETTTKAAKEMADAQQPEYTQAEQKARVQEDVIRKVHQKEADRAMDVEREEQIHDMEGKPLCHIDEDLKKELREHPLSPN